MDRSDGQRERAETETEVKKSKSQALIWFSGSRLGAEGPAHPEPPKEPEKRGRFCGSGRFKGRTGSPWIQSRGQTVHQKLYEQALPRFGDPPPAPVRGPAVQRLSISRTNPKSPNNPRGRSERPPAKTPLLSSARGAEGAHLSSETADGSCPLFFCQV